MIVASVLLADDHARTRAMVRHALEQSGDFVVCAEAADAAGAVEGARQERPDVCLLDINMPGNGIAAAAEITAALPGTAVVMLTVSRQDEDLFDALRGRSVGLPAEGARRGTVSASRCNGYWRGRQRLPGTLVARLVDEFRDREQHRVAVADGQAARLTGREWDVLELMRKGATTTPRSQSGSSSRRRPSVATFRPFCASSACRHGRRPSSCSTRERELRRSSRAGTGRLTGGSGAGPKLAPATRDRERQHGGDRGPRRPLLGRPDPALPAPLRHRHRDDAQAAHPGLRDPQGCVGRSQP